MPDMNTLNQWLQTDEAAACLAQLYGRRKGTLEMQITRYQQALSAFSAIFGDGGDIALFSTSGRTEVGGNHTDHNHGLVLAASVDLDTIAVVRPTGTDVVRIKSEGFDMDTVSLDALEPCAQERHTSSALIRGVATGLRARGYRIGGFDAYTTSRVLKGSGLSSSAAFEVLVASIFNHSFNHGAIPAMEAAQTAQYAENAFFGKPSGLLDQAACSLGGFVTIDFGDSQNPEAQSLAFDFERSGYTLVICDTGGNHANLNDEYAAVAQEMRSVARALGGEVLRDIPEARVLEEIPRLRRETGDRAILRALHYYDENRRVTEEVEALRRGDMDAFLTLVNASGDSSWRLLQNCYTADAAEQGVTLALAIAARALGGRGACRVHGGGFAGTIQAFVPNDLLAAFLVDMRAVFGADSCYELLIRPYGAYRLPV